MKEAMKQFYLPPQGFDAAKVELLWASLTHTQQEAAKKQAAATLDRRYGFVKPAAA